MPNRCQETKGIAGRAATQVMSRDVGAWRRARGGHMGDVAWGNSLPAGRLGPVDRSRPGSANVAQPGHSWIRVISKNISTLTRFGPRHSRWAVTLGYSVYVFPEGIGVRSGVLRQHLLWQVVCACTVQRHRPTSLRRPVGHGCGLNSRQINHLQRNASETHYRGRREGRESTLKNHPGRTECRRGGAAGRGG